LNSERAGAPVVTFLRIDDQAICLPEPAMTPDALPSGCARLLADLL
jgi:hypothetical protein